MCATIWSVDTGMSGEGMWKVRFVFQQGIWSNGNRPATTLFTCSSLEVYMFVLRSSSSFFSCFLFPLIWEEVKVTWAGLAEIRNYWKIRLGFFCMSITWGNMLYLSVSLVGEGPVPGKQFSSRCCTTLALLVLEDCKSCMTWFGWPHWEGATKSETFFHRLDYCPG